MRNCIKFLFFIFCLIAVSYNNAFSLDCVNARFLFDIKGDIDQPSDVSVSQNGDIYFVDGVNNRIVAVDNLGRFKFTFGKRGSGKGEFDLPLGIDISSDDKIYIADTGNKRIQVFDLEGNILTMFSTVLESDRNTSEPVDVLVSKFKDYLYVSDNNNHEIKVYDRGGRFKLKWGKFGEGYGEFRYPATMSANSLSEVFIADVINTRVQRFSPMGDHINNIGVWGVHPGDFFRPKGVSVSKDGWVFVSDSYMGVVQVFSSAGKFDGVICENNKKKVFRTPVGVFVDKDSRLLVVEMRANKITVLKILQ